jgi:hypothetical protein
MGKKYITYGEYKDIVKDVRKANQRIRRIQSRYGDNAWALRNLTDKLDNKLIKAINPYSGEIRIRKNMNQAVLNAVRRATKEFLDAKTSTLIGIRRAKENVLSGLRASLSDDEITLDDKEMQALFRIVEDDDIKTTVEFVGASTLWRLMIDAKEKNMNENDWFNLLKDYNINGNDLDIREDLSRIFNNYILK